MNSKTLTPEIITNDLPSEVAAIANAAAIHNLNVEGDFNFYQQNNYNSITIDAEIEGWLQENNLLELFDKYMKSKKRNSDTKKTYFAGLVKFYIFLFDAQVRIANLAAEDIATYQECLSNNYKITSEISYTRIATAFLAWLTRRTSLVVDFDCIVTPAIENTHRKDPISAQQKKQLLNSFDTSTVIGLRDKTIVELMVHNGLRVVEINRLKYESIDFKKQGLAVLGKGKTETVFVRLHATTFNLLLQHLTANKPIEEYKTSDPLFLAHGVNGGNGLSRRSISRLVKTALTGQGLKSKMVTAHSLRHTLADSLVRQGVAINDIQRFMRHKSSDTTLIYLNKYEKEQRDTVCPLDLLG